MEKERTKDMEENIIWGSKITRLILVYLGKKGVDYVSNIARKIKCAPDNLQIKFKELKREGLIESIENKGKNRYPFVYMSKKNKYYKLTAKGKRITKLLLKIDGELK